MHLKTFPLKTWLSHWHGAHKPRRVHTAPRGGCRWQLEQLEDRVLPAVLDLTAAGAVGILNNAIFSQFTPGPKGSGAITAFLKLSTNQAVEQGYNSDFRPVQFNEVTTGSFDYALKLGLVPTIVAGGGQLYYEFLLDITQSSSSPNNLLSLDDLRVYVTKSSTVNPNLLHNYSATGHTLQDDAGALYFPVYDLNPGTSSNYIKLDANLSSGLGTGDMIALLPATQLGTDPNQYVYLYSKFGVHYANTSGAEQWASSSALPIGSISGLNFVDSNGNGARGAGEPALAGVTVYLDANNNGVLDAGEVSTVTAADGSFSFTNLAAGTYHVQEVIPSGYTQTARLSADVTLSAGQNVTGVTFGDFKLGSISGTEFEDLTGDGFSSDDPVLNSANPHYVPVTVQLYRGSTLVATTATDANGNYIFTGVGPGTYTVSAVMPTGWVQTAATGATIAATSGFASTGNNFDAFKLGTISGTEFQDITGNGFTSDDPVLNSSDPDFVSVVVQLFRGSTLVVTTTTDTNGNYSFAGIGPGTYTVTEANPNGWIKTAVPQAILATSGLASTDNFDLFKAVHVLSDGTLAISTTQLSGGSLSVSQSPSNSTNITINGQNAGSFATSTIPSIQISGYAGSTVDTTQVASAPVTILDHPGDNTYHAGSSGTTIFVNNDSTENISVTGGLNTLNFSTNTFGITFNANLNQGQLQSLDSTSTHFLGITGSFQNLVGTNFNDTLVAPLPTLPTSVTATTLNSFRSTVDGGGGNDTLYGTLMSTVTASGTGTSTLYAGLPTPVDNTALQSLFGNINALAASGTSLQTLFGDLTTVLKAGNSGTTTLFGDVLSTLNGSNSGTTTMYAGLPTGVSSPNLQTLFGEIGTLGTITATNPQTLFGDLGTVLNAGTSPTTMFGNVLTTMNGGSGTATMYAALPVGVTGLDTQTLYGEINALSGGSTSAAQTLFGDLSTVMNAGTGGTTMFGDLHTTMNGGSDAATMYAGLPPSLTGLDLPTLFGEITTLSGTSASAAQTLFGNLGTIMNAGTGTTTMFGGMQTTMNGGAAGNVTMYAGLPAGLSGLDVPTLFGEIGALSSSTGISVQTLFGDLSTVMNAGTGSTTMFGDVHTTMNGGSGVTTMFAGVPTGVQPLNLQSLFASLGQLPAGSLGPQTLFGDLSTVMKAGTGSTTMFGDVLTAMHGGSGTATMYAGLPQGLTGVDLPTLFGEINMLSGPSAATGQTLFGDLSTIMNAGAGTTTMYGNVMTTINGGSSGNVTMYAGLPTLQDNNDNPVPILSPSLPTLFSEINALAANPGAATQTLFGDLGTVMNASSTGTTTMFGNVLTTMNGSASGSTTMYAGVPASLSGSDLQTLFGEINTLATSSASAQSLFTELVVQMIGGAAGGTYFGDALSHAQGGVGTNTMYAGLPAGLVGPDPVALQTEINTLATTFGPGLGTLYQLLTPTLQGGTGYNIMFGAPGALLIAGPGVNSLYAALPPTNDTGIPAKSPNVPTTLQGGAGTDTFLFAGGNLGHVYVTKAAGAGACTLDFTDFAAAITLDISQTTDQVVSPGNLTLTLSDPNGITNVIGTRFADQIHGNGTSGLLESTHQLDDRASLTPPPPLNLVPVVFFDFDSYTTAGKHVYTQAERDAIQARMATNYAAFNYQFTQTLPSGGVYATIFFNKSSIVNGQQESGGQSDEIDFRRLDQRETASVDVNGLLGGPGQPPATSADFIAASATIASHELGHLSGLRHADAFGPIGVGIHDAPGAGSFLPVYPGPTAAFETTFDIMASPDSVGSTLAEAVGNPAFGARDDIKLAFATDGTVVNEQSTPHQSFAAAQPLTLAPLAVPNTLRQGLDAGKTFEVTAIDVTGSIGIDPTTQHSEDDYYSFVGRSGDDMTFEVMSASLPADRLSGLPIDSVLSVYDSPGNLLGYYSSTAQNDDQFEPPDSLLVDLKLPYTGTYYVVVDTFHFLPGDPRDPGSGAAHTDTETGNYELFMYQFDAAFANEQGHTLIAGSGNEILKGGAGNDAFIVGSGHDSLIGVGGTDTVQASGASRYTLTNTRLTGIGIADLSGIQNAVLTGSATGTTFDLSGWTGAATVIGVGGINTIVVTRDVNFTLSNNTLTLSDGTVITLQNIQNVVLTGGPGNNTFDASGWTGAATFDGQSGVNTIVVNRAGNYVLTDNSLVVSSGGTFQLSSIQSAVLTGSTGSVFDVRGYSGTDLLNIAGGANPVATPRGVNVSTSEGIVTVAVGTFTDLGTTVATNYTVSVNWGDNSTSAGSTSVSGNAITLNGAHAYTEEGNYTLTTTFSQGAAFSVIIGSAATVADSQLTSASGLTINSVEGVSFSGAVATFTDPGGSEPVGDYAATIDWGDNSGANPVGTITDKGSGHFTVTGTHSYREEGSYTVQVTLHHDLLPAIVPSNGTAQVADAAITPSSSALTAQQGIGFTNRQVASFTDANPQGPLTDFTATVAWGDGATTGGAITQPGGVGTPFIVSGSHTYGVAGIETVTVTIKDLGGQLATTSFVLTVQPSIFVLSPTAGGALTLKGTVAINIAGAVVVDSNSANALTASGNAQLTAVSIQVVGGVSVSNGAILNPTPVTLAQPVMDPLAGLAAPSGGTNRGAVNLTKGSLTINPGIYSQIAVSGTGTTLNMNPGVYVITGGGFSVSNSASVNGSGVLIYNAGSNFPATGRTFGAIMLGSSGAINLSGPSSGPYAGVLIFQSRDNTATLSLNASAAVGLNGTIYAPSALLSLGGSSQLKTPAIVNMLTLNGNGGSALTDAGSAIGPDVADPPTNGSLFVYINDPNGTFTSDERARLDDAVSGVNPLLATFGTTISEVSSRAAANLIVDMGVTSASGAPADGVLGCYVPSLPVREITLLSGWNWYAGANPALIRPDQFDFETVALHELGHALGLGHSPDPGSVMYETLPAGATRRALTADDFHVPEAGETSGRADPELIGTTDHDAFAVAVLYADQTVTGAGSAVPIVPVVGQNSKAVGVTPVELPSTPTGSSQPFQDSVSRSAALLPAPADAWLPVARHPMDGSTAAGAIHPLALDLVMREQVRRAGNTVPSLPGPLLGRKIQTGHTVDWETFDANSPVLFDANGRWDADQLGPWLVVTAALAVPSWMPQRATADRLFAKLARQTRFSCRAAEDE
jgi:hypothetical protein